MGAVLVPEAEAAERPAGDERELIAALRADDTGAFERLVERHGPAMLRLARLHLRDRFAAEEVVQDAWLSVLRGVARFEGRCSLKTWIFRILINRARTRRGRDARSLRLASLEALEEPRAEELLGAGRFLPASHPLGPRHWAVPPRPWPKTPEEGLLGRELLRQVEAAIAGLPAAQGQVLALRDVEGWNAAEVCRVLGLSEGNQRVLLHRARTRVRRALAAHLTGERP